MPENGECQYFAACGAELAHVGLDVIVNDELDLPEKLPSSKKHEGMMRKERFRNR